MADGLPTPRRYGAVFALSCGNALVIMDGVIATVALPTLARDLKVDSSTAVLVVTVYQLVLLMALLPFSALGERFGLKRVYQTGLAVFTVATGLCFFANSFPFLLIVRVVQSLGAAAALSVSSTMVRNTYPSDMLGRGLSFNSVVVTSAAALAPTLGGIILAFASWPWVFAMTVPFGLLSLITGRYLPNPPPRDTPYDVVGALLCAAAFGLVVFGGQSMVHGDSPVVSAAVVVIGVVLGTIFIRRQLTDPQPILPVDLLAQPIIALSAVGSLAAFIASMMLILSMPFRLAHDYGMHPAAIGAVLAAWPVTMIFVAPTAGTLSDKYPAGVLGGIGMTIAMTGLGLVAWLPADAGVWDIAWRMSLCGLGFGLYTSPNARLILGSAPLHRAASAGALISTLRLSGQMIGATTISVLLAMDLGGGPVPPMIGMALALIAGVCSVARLNPALRNPTREEVHEVQSTMPPE